MIVLVLTDIEWRGDMVQQNGGRKNGLNEAPEVAAIWAPQEAPPNMGPEVTPPHMAPEVGLDVALTDKGLKSGHFMSKLYLNLFESSRKWEQIPAHIAVQKRLAGSYPYPFQSTNRDCCWQGKE
jgi:hypothetical protein